MNFYIQESPSERKKTARACALGVLHAGENRLALVLAGIASAVVSFVARFVTWALSLALYEMPFGEALEPYSFLVWLGSQLLTLALFWLFAMPLWLGMYYMAIRMTDGYSVGAEDFFRYIGDSGLYARALGISARLILRWFPALVGFLFMQLCFDFDFIGFLLVCFFAITLVLSILFASGLGGLVTAALSDDSLEIDKAKKIAAASLGGERMCVFRFHLGMACRMLLSLLPAGVVLMLHTLPMSMLSAVCYARRMAARGDIDDT